MEDYIENVNDLKKLLIDDCIREELKDEDNTIFIDQEEIEDGIRCNYFLNESEKSFCKIEYTSKGVHFYQRKQL